MTDLNQKKYYLTLTFLCLGYFIDFYDLTIFQVSYIEIIHSLFGITDPNEVQQLRIYFTNWQLMGILAGSLLFGVIGDKFGRVTTLRWSILLYSSSILLSLFASSITLFAILRFLAGAGLACEFATSNILIAELLPAKKASKNAARLYICGVLGGMTATFLGFFSWEIMFLFGGVSGLLLYLVRKKVDESGLYLQVSSYKTIEKGRLLSLVNNKASIIKLSKLLMLILPLQFLFASMFIYPQYMPLSYSLPYANKLLLLGFFLGNILSCLVSSYYIKHFKNYTGYLWATYALLLIILPSFNWVSDNTFFIYSCFLGLLGGGYPTVWIQLVTKSYGTNMRNTAGNLLFALGRISGIVFNLLIALWLTQEASTVVLGLILTGFIVVMISVTSLLNIKDNYDRSLSFWEKT